MAENSSIEWTTHSWNPWRGCTKVSEGCRNCYADAMSKRNPLTLGVWGPNGTRVVASEAQWRLPLKWNREAESYPDQCAKCGVRLNADAQRQIGNERCPSQKDEAGQLDTSRSKCGGEIIRNVRHRVFCASLADVFEDWTGPMSVSDGRWLSKPYLDSESGPENWQLEYPETWKADPQGWRIVTMSDVRARLFRLIDATPNLDWLLLTKRPENIAKMMPPVKNPNGGWDRCSECGASQTNHLIACKSKGEYRANVWLGTSVENQAAADERIPHLLRVPAAVRFLSCEPLLGPVDLSLYLRCESCLSPETCWCSDARVNWVIAGGESGHGARPCRVEWIRGIVEQCKAAGVPCFVKQVGAFVVDRNDRGFDAESEVFADGPNAGQPTDSQAWPNAWMDVEHNINGFREEYQGADCRVHLRDKKGGDMQEWPLDLRVRQFPAICRPCVESANG